MLSHYRVTRWVTVKGADLSEVRFDNNFDKLIFPSDHKETILALVETHEKARSEASEGSRSVGAALNLVKGKGNGLIILLHSEPGKHERLMKSIHLIVFLNFAQASARHRRLNMWPTN